MDKSLAINQFELRIVAHTAYAGRAGNPYNWLLYSNMKANVSEFVLKSFHAEKCDVFHIHWPESSLNTHRNALVAFLRLRLLLFRIDQYRSKGAKLVWTVHNLKSHEGFHPRLEAWFWRKFLARLSGVIALSDSGLEAARRAFPGLAQVPGCVIRHGHYRDEYPNDPGLDARGRLGIDSQKKVFLFFGQIRRYKNIPKLIEALSRLAGDDYLLYVVGKSARKKDDRHLEELAAGDKRVRLHLDHVAPNEVQMFFRAADLVVLPFRDILNSGTAILSLSFNRPILVPRRGAMAELRELVGKEWVRTYDGDLNEGELAEGMRWALTEGRAEQAPLEALEWPTLAAKTVEAFRDICEQDGFSTIRCVKEPAREAPCQGGKVLQ